MTLVITTEPISLETDADGIVHVGRTRVTLDTIVAAFNDGATAEEIVHQYPSLHLADVYAVISYYLRQRSEVEAYLHQRRQQAAHIRKQNEARFDPHGVRDRLLARRTVPEGLSGLPDCGGDRVNFGHREGACLASVHSSAS